MSTEKKKSILLVEDEAIIALTEKNALDKLGYEVDIAPSGEAAIALIENGAQFDLILMDIDLGRGMDGTEAAEIISENRDIPIVFLSSHTTSEVVEKTEKITSYGYVVKDSNIAVLHTSIKMAFKLFEANQETRRANEKLRAIISSFPDLVFILDRDGYYLSYEKSPGFAYLVLPEEEIIGSHVSAVHPPEEAALVVDYIRRCLSTGEVISYNYSMAIRGENRDFDLRISRINEESVLAVVRDITNIQRANMELRLLSQAVNQVSSIIVITDREGRIEYVNPRFEEVTGYSMEEARNKIARDLMQSLLDDSTFDDFWKTLHAGKPWRGIFINRKKSGEIFHEMAIVSPVRNAKGEISNFISVKEDLSEQQEIEDALRKNQSLLTEMGNIAKVGGWRTDLESRNVEWTDELFNIYEVDPSFLTHIEPIMNFLLPESRKMADAAIAQSMETGDSFDLEAEILTGKGNHRWIRMIGRPVYTGDRITHRIGASQDITDRKKSEELLRLNERKILSLLNEKEILLQEVHHRVKNNMATMTSLLSLQAEGLKDPSAVSALRDAQSRFRSMTILYDKLYYTDNFQETSIKSYLPSLINDIVRMSPKYYNLVLESDIDEFSLSIRELSTLGIILNELLTNAIKHAFPEEGGGLLRISASKEKGLVKLTVEDKGVGIPQEKEDEEPSGFGLMLVQSLTQQLRGKMKIETGNGTRVSIEFRPQGPEKI